MCTTKNYNFKVIYGKDDMVSQLLRDSDNSVLQLCIVDLIHILDTASSARGGLLCSFLQLAFPFSVPKRKTTCSKPQTSTKETIISLLALIDGEV